LTFGAIVVKSEFCSPKSTPTTPGHEV